MSCRAPKAKFTFKRRPAAPASQSPPPLASDAPRNKPQTPHPNVPSTDNLRLSSRTSAHFTLSSLARPADIPLSQTIGLSDVTLTSLQACIVNLFPLTSPKDSLSKSEPTRTITALHAKALSRVVLIMPPIDGSVLLHEIHDSVIIVGCHQVRPQVVLWLCPTHHCYQIVSYAQLYEYDSPPSRAIQPNH